MASKVHYEKGSAGGKDGITIFGRIKLAVVGLALGHCRLR